MCRFRWATLATSEPGFRRTGNPQNRKVRAQRLHACTLETRRLLPNLCAFLVGLAGLGVLARKRMLPGLAIPPTTTPRNRTVAKRITSHPFPTPPRALPPPCFHRLAEIATRIPDSLPIT